MKTTHFISETLRRASRSAVALAAAPLALMTLAPPASAQPDLPRVHVIATGGTIADESTGNLNAEELVDALPAIRNIATITAEDFSSIGSSRMTPELQLSLSLRVRELIESDDADGFVITHGTDSLEETAFLLDITVPDGHPVVFAAAQRPPRRIDTDGPRNLLNAIRLAASEAMRPMGVTLTLNDTILAAREARKTHSIAVDAFSSAWSGPLGFVDDSKIYLFHRPLRRVTIPTDRVEPRVDLIRLVAGSDEGPIDDALARGSRAIVVEVFGRGNVPPKPMGAIARARAATIPVVFVSRTGGGRVEIDQTAREIGVISGENLDGLKARMTMCVALGAGMSEAEIALLFRRLAGETGI